MAKLTLEVPGHGTIGLERADRLDVKLVNPLQPGAIVQGFMQLSMSEDDYKRALETNETICVLGKDVVDCDLKLRFSLGGGGSSDSFQDFSGMNARYGES